MGGKGGGGRAGMNTEIVFDLHGAMAWDPPGACSWLEIIYDTHFEIPDEVSRDNIDLPTQRSGS